MYQNNSRFSFASTQGLLMLAKNGCQRPEASNSIRPARPSPTGTTVPAKKIISSGAWEGKYIIPIVFRPEESAVSSGYYGGTADSSLSPKGNPQLGMTARLIFQQAARSGLIS